MRVARPARALRPWSTVASRQRRWTREGLWDRILAVLQCELADAGRIDCELWRIDGQPAGPPTTPWGAARRLPTALAWDKGYSTQSLVLRMPHRNRADTDRDSLPFRG